MSSRVYQDTWIKVADDHPSSRFGEGSQEGRGLSFTWNVPLSLANIFQRSTRNGGYPYALWLDKNVIFLILLFIFCTILFWNQWHCTVVLLGYLIGSGIVVVCTEALLIFKSVYEHGDCLKPILFWSTITTEGKSRSFQMLFHVFPPLKQHVNPGKREVFKNDHINHWTFSQKMRPSCQSNSGV